MIQIGAVCTTFCQEEGILCKSIAIEMGGASRYLSKVSGSGVDSTLLINVHLAKLLKSTLVFGSGGYFLGGSSSSVFLWRLCWKGFCH